MANMEEKNIKQESEQDVELVVTLLDGNGEAYEATILNSFVVEEKQYVSALPVMPDESGEFPILLFAAHITESEGEESQIEIVTIPDEEYSKIAEYYEQHILPLDIDRVP